MATEGLTNLTAADSSGRIVLTYLSHKMIQVTGTIKEWFYCLPMVYLAKTDEMEDVGFCSAKEEEYAAKARATNNRAVKSAYEAAAREFAYRVKLIGSKKAKW